MTEYHWNKLKKRLANIVAPNLNIAFNNARYRKKTQRSEISIKLFHIKLDKEIIWRFPDDTQQIIDENYSWGHFLTENREFESIEFPIQSILKYLDLPKEKLIDYQDKAGIADILKACDRRIGYNRLKNLNLSDAGQKIFNKRFKNK